MIVPASPTSAATGAPRATRRPVTWKRYHGGPVRNQPTVTRPTAWCTIVTMGIKVDREQLRPLVEPHWRRLYNFVFRLTLDRDRAERYLMDIFAAAAAQIDRQPVGATEGEIELWLLGIANKLLEDRLPRQP